jgi:hypothetical protein
MDFFDMLAPATFILVCGLFADNLTIRTKIKDLTLRIKELEKDAHDQD